MALVLMSSSQKRRAAQAFFHQAGYLVKRDAAARSTHRLRTQLVRLVLIQACRGQEAAGVSRQNPHAVRWRRAKRASCLPLRESGTD
jgi:hypothetical protein